MHVFSNDVLAKLLVLYSKEKDINGLMEIYKALYENTKDEKVLTKIVELYAYTRDIDGAIEFLEKYEAGDEILYELYKNKKLFTKALNLIDNKYTKSKDAKWLAEKGILLFESSKNKDDKKMINEVVSLFEKALSLGVDDSIYLNYFGYTLIDKEIDIDRGMQIIENALVQQPNNTYYLGSLAWGHYKKRECSKAYKYMKRVVDEEGLVEDEIISHWHTIKQCK
jgi:tetratricopeptide (TPR) repeat protein